MELYEFMLHKCMILRHFGAKTVEYPVPKIFKKSFWLKEKLTATFITFVQTLAFLAIVIAYLTD